VLAISEDSFFRAIKTNEREYAMTKKWNYNLETFYNEDDVSYYLLGAIMTDGNIQQYAKGQNSGGRVGITSKDGDWLQLINAFICPEKPVKDRAPRNCHEATYSCNELVDWFVSKGCAPRKSLTLEFPEVPKKYIPDFLRGVTDGDGSISFGKAWRKDRNCFELMKRQCAIYTSSPAFEKGLRKAFEELDIPAFTYARNFGPRKIENRIITSTNTNWRVALKSGEGIAKFLELAYYEGNRIAMPRKAAIAAELIKDWKRPFFCHDCKVELHLTKNNRFQLYCSNCSSARAKGYSA